MSRVHVGQRLPVGPFEARKAAPAALRPLPPV